MESILLPPGGRIDAISSLSLPMICPHITEIKNEKDLIFISPGEIKREKIAKEISEILGRERDEIASILPPGGSRIDSITKKVQASISQ